MQFSLVQWLEEEVGFDDGEDPAPRRGLYFKLGRLYKRYDDRVLRIIAETWDYVCNANDISGKAHWFVKSVKIRLKKLGLWHEPSRFDGLTGDALIREGFKRRASLPLFDGDGQGKAGETMRAKQLRMIEEQKARERDERECRPDIQ